MLEDRLRIMGVSLPPGPERGIGEIPTSETSFLQEPDRTTGAGSAWLPDQQLQCAGRHDMFGVGVVSAHTAEGRRHLDEYGFSDARRFGVVPVPHRRGADAHRVRNRVATPARVA